MKIEYEIKGVTLDIYDMINIHKYYEAACTAEYLMENYELTDEDAMKLGYEVRRMMDKHGLYEEDAIEKVMSNMDDYLEE